MEKKSRSVAALLAFFLGCYGGQYFYLTRPRAGILCILFFWTLIPSFIGVWHAVKFSFMSEDAFNEYYAKNRS